MTRHPRATAVVASIAAIAIAGIAAPAPADEGGRTMKAELSGLEEVPAISTTGTGEFLARIAQDESSVTYTLRYQSLEGTTTAAAHIHLGQPSVSGGVMVFLCGGGGTPACPPTAGEVSGTITAESVIGPTGQGIAPGEFAEVIAAMRAGATYANVHTNKHPGGEIRGQLK